ncbi:MAG: hypothetical protein M3Q85_11015 [Acidobacteriota bacterium]|nr:hypothetical protein [Acidobacteriota bacterium]
MPRRVSVSVAGSGVTTASKPLPPNVKLSTANAKKRSAFGTLDPAPAWNRTSDGIVVKIAEDGTRQMFLLELPQ